MTEGFICFADDGRPIVQCWQCGGEGRFPDCDEEWACLHPEEGCDLCMRTCDICHGKGSFAVSPKTSVQEHEEKP